MMLILHTPTINQKNQKREREITWFNPPVSKSVSTNVATALVIKHFPTSHKLHKMFNLNTDKVSCSCINNMSKIIKEH